MNTQTVTFSVKTRGISSYDFGEYFVCVYIDEWSEEKEINTNIAKTVFRGNLINDKERYTDREIIVYCKNQSIINSMIETFGEGVPLLIQIKNGEILDFCLWKWEYI